MDIPVINVLGLKIALIILCSLTFKDISSSSGDYNALADLIKQLDVADLRQIGKNSKEIYFRKYNKKLFIDRLLNELKNLSK